MNISSPAARRGVTLSRVLLAAGIAVAVFRFAVNDGSTGGLFLLFVTFIAAAIAVYARVAVLESIRAANHVIDKAPREHLASVHPIRTPESSDVA